MRNLRISLCGGGACKKDGPPTVERNLAQASGMLRQAAAEGADLAVLPEIFALLGTDRDMESPEPLDGKVPAALSKLARELSMGIAAGHLTKEHGKVYNSLLLFDRKGALAAVYHKAYPTVYELERGITPGDGALAVDTEFGRIGFAICYDLNFPELRLKYRDLNPDLILFSSMFRGGLQAQWWAFETRSHFASACVDPRSIIANPVGRIVAATDVISRSVTATINLDCEVLHLDYCNKRLDEARARHGKHFSFEWAEAEGVMLVSSLGAMTVPELIREYGWETAEEYLRGSRRKRESAAAGERIPKGPAPW